MARPNIIVVVTDDQGYGDLACHGNPHIRTPHMDRLHSESVRFTNFHVDPTCSPTRAALMTGCYSHRVNVWHTIMGRNYMDHERQTMPERFAAAGYRTGHFGKWHLGGHVPYRPIDRGFEEWLGQGDGGTGCMTDHWANRRVDDIYLHNGTKRRIPGYGPDVFFDAAMEYAAKPDERPFFIYLATYIPHNPTSLPDSHWADAYRDEVPIRTAYFYSAIERADYNLGRLRARLCELGLVENTILLFMTDNGTAQGHHVFNAGMRGNKGDVYDGGHRVPCFLHWPAAGMNEARDVDGLTSHIDLMPTLLDLAGAAPDAGVTASPDDIDGISLAGVLREDAAVPDRTLVVESQRIRVPEKYRAHAVMRGSWRLVNQDELYDVATDPGQEHNVASEHPDLVTELQASYERYWEHVIPGDESFGRPRIGGDEAVELCTEHLYADSDDAFCWNQLHVVKAVPITGEWPVEVEQAGPYRFAVRRWPEELAAPIRGVPRHSTAEAGARAKSWLFDEEVTDILYGAADGAAPAEDLPVALSVHSVRLEAGEQTEVLLVTDDADCVATELTLPSGPQSIRAEMLAADGGVIGAPYYVTVTRLA